jgi:hypothetical protein
MPHPRRLPSPEKHATGEMTDSSNRRKSSIFRVSC